MEGTRTQGLTTISHRGEAAVYAAKALEPATAPCEASRQKLTGENDELRAPLSDAERPVKGTDAGSKRSTQGTSGYGRVSRAFRSNPLGRESFQECHASLILCQQVEINLQGRWCTSDRVRDVSCQLYKQIMSIQVSGFN
jgi:hypothetical protein